jgi:hypothetical protein
MWPFRVPRIARLQHAWMAILAQGCAQVLLVRVVLCDVSLGVFYFDFWAVRGPVSFELHVMYEFLHANPSVVAK